MFSSSSPSPPALSKPLTTAARFIHLYYKSMANEPEGLYNYYDDDSAAVRITSDTLGQMVDHESVIGQLAIHELLTKQNYANCKVKIETVDVQESLNESLIVVVTGLLILAAVDGKTSQPVSFVHTFLLARVEGTTGYYVRNDMLRTLEHLPVHSYVTVQPPTEQAAQPTETKPKSPVITSLPVVGGKLQAAEMASPARSAPRRVSLSHPTPVDPNAPHMPDTLAPPLSPERKAIAAVAPSSPPKSSPLPAETAASVTVTDASATPAEVTPAVAATAASSESAQPAASKQGGRRGNQAGRGKAANAKQAQAAQGQAQTQQTQQQQQPSSQTTASAQPQAQAAPSKPAAPAKPMSWANRVAVKPAAPVPTQSSPTQAAAAVATPVATPSAAPTPVKDAAPVATPSADNDGQGEFKPVGRTQRREKPQNQQQRGDGERSERSERGSHRGGRGGRSGAAA